jgi:hypothetical protein
MIRGDGMKNKNESGIALISALLILVLLGVLLEGFIVSINSDQKLIGNDRDQNRAFYGALSGMEKLTADLGVLYDDNYAPTNAEIQELTTDPPEVPYIDFIKQSGASGYEIQSGTIVQRTIPSGSYEGLIGLMTPYTVTVTARTPTSGEVKMRRNLQLALVPVFQFGIFSKTDLSFFAGPNFNFGGRVHSNANIYIAEGSGNTLTMGDRVTAYKKIIRSTLSNGWPTSNSYTGTIKVMDYPSHTGTLAISEDSNYAQWPAVVTRFNTNIRDGNTGAKKMDLPIVKYGASAIDLIRRPAQNSNEDTDKPNIFQQRFYSLASLRIILSDKTSDITTLPTIATGTPVSLNDTGWTLTTEHIASSNRPASCSTPVENCEYRTSKDTNLIDGFIKIEMRDNSDTWNDVTAEILGLGVSGQSISGTGCTNMSSYFPNSIIHIQRLKDYGSVTTCGSTKYEFWPNTLYDTREGIYRDNISTASNRIYLGGIMNYVEINIANLARWFRGQIGVSGTNAYHQHNGYVVYFSDRRTNHHPDTDVEMAEYGYEDFVNRTDIPNGLPNGVCDVGENVNRINDEETETTNECTTTGSQELYGGKPRYPTGITFQSPFNSTSLRPKDTLTGTTTGDKAAGVARKNRPVFFRRALKLYNGARIDLGNNSGGIPWGLTIASENPVYIQGNFNANDASNGFNGNHLAASIIADAVTLLSNSWNDKLSFDNPNNPGNRAASTTWYRTAIIAGKGLPFPNIDMNDSDKRDFGTDGGAHNFLRYLEDWGSSTLNYRGSIISLFINRQAVGTYKCCTNVYSPPTRGYNFDVEFLNPATLPPETPNFRDINITGFTQVKAPNQ